MILIVDDKKENLFSLRILLELQSYPVDTALSGEEALKKILKNEYALIILDVQMPGMDGFEVADTITGYSKSKDIPIIFLSAVSIDKRFITRGYASGGVDYVTKPFDPDLLLLKVKTFYKLYHQAKELRAIKVSLEEKVAQRTQELHQLNKELELSNTELQQYASIASHDLQEPLRKIITFSYLISEKLSASPAEAAEYMKKVIASAQRMRNLIYDLLAYSELSSGSHLAQIDLNALLQETLSDLELTIQEKKAIMHIGALPVIEGIPGQMRQVFQNIISNALKFSCDNQLPEIRIWSELLDQNAVDAPAAPTGNFVRIFIQDNGIGFDEAFINKIFTLFQRLHLKNEYAGTGIGLAVVKKIIEKHNGNVTAKSKKGEGATFIIVLPLKQLASPVQA